MLVRRVSGDSMLPWATPGQLMVARRRSDYRMGDVVIAHQDGREVLKRINKIDKEDYFLQGDNMAHSTDSRQHGPVKRNDILGRVIVRLPAAVAAVPFRHRRAAWLGWGLAAAFITLSLIHLFRIDTLLPIVDTALPAGLAVAAGFVVLVTISEVLALPYLMTMRLSPLGHIVSGGLVVLAPLLWTLITIWNMGDGGAGTGQLGEFVSLYAGWPLLVVNLTWLGACFWLLWLRNYELQASLLRKAG